jgi:hypothetical protein
MNVVGIVTCLIDARGDGRNIGFVVVKTRRRLFKADEAHHGQNRDKREHNPPAESSKAERRAHNYLSQGGLAACKSF